MSPRAGTGPALTGLGLVGLLASLLLGWGHAGTYGVDALGEGFDVHVAVPAGWSYLGHPWVELLVVACGTAVAVLVVRLRTGGVPPALRTVAAAVVGVALAATALRALLLRPTGEFGTSVVSTLATTDRLGAFLVAQPDAHPWPGLGAVVGLAALAVLLVGILLPGGGSAPESAPTAVRTRLRRLPGRGELLAAAGAVVLLGSAFLAVFTADEGRSCSGSLGAPVGGDAAEGRGVCGVAVEGATLVLEDRHWDALGHPWVELVALVLVAVAVVVALALRGGPGRSSYGPVTALVVAVPVAALALGVAVVRLFVVRPGVRIPGPTEGVPGGDASLAVATGGWILLAGLALILAGLWAALADDRTRGSGDVPAPSPREVPLPRAGT
ncbi:hypothetical protein [Patulibacter minatonensis]|uniref:hypothetical protein n=1 Tax=Patulibacter minatonensis TaxID=298163 RepID=UPI0004799259|nr:hypothetical protein [Patulibacter minatonensis]